MMRRKLGYAIVAAALAGSPILAACGSSDDDEATPASMTQTSATEPATTAPEPATTAPEPATTEAEPEPETTEAEPEPDTTEAEPEPTRPGEVAVGRQVFQGSCEGCHADGGRQSAYGPRIAGLGLSEAQIRRVVVNGQGQMPAGLVSGQDLEDVVVYVESLQ